MKAKFNYLDLDDIQGGWAELYQAIPNWIEEIRNRKYEPLEKEEELDLIRTAKYGTGIMALRAKEEVIRRNLRFVVNISRHYLHITLDAQHLISLGNEALVTAFDKFDPEREVKFITYAVNLIRCSMIEALRTTSAITIPARAVRLIKDYIEYGDLEKLKELFPDKYPESIKKLEEKLEGALVIRYMSSLDVEFEDGSSLSETIADKPSNVFTYGDEIRAIIKAAQLDPMEQAVIHLNFGLEGDKPLGLRKVADKVGSNLTKVSKIRKSAFEKLKGIERLQVILEEVNESDAITWATPTSYQSPE